MEIIEHTGGRVRRAPSLERLQELLSYDPQTGEFSWLEAKGGRIVGARAGCLSPVGYRVIRVDGRKYPAHWLAWVISYGSLPDAEIDHRDCNRTNNAIANLREATRSQNVANSRVSPRNKLKLKGVCYRPDNGKYRAYIKTGGKQRSLGVYDTAEEAHAAYARAASETFGEFARIA